MAEIKTDENASEVLDRDLTNGVLCVTSKACRRKISTVHLKYNRHDLIIMI